MNNSFKTPILFLIFNRPDTTVQVFESISQAKPAYLYVAADGPRKDKSGEAEKCEQTRKLVTDNIDWPCEVKTLFRDENLGCGKAVSSAITWFFENVEEGIILEDDCLPNLSFFSFCQELLEHYRFEESIYVISGDNFQNQKIGTASYYFSAYSHIWGWASWRRAWNKYTFSIVNVDNDVFRDSLKNYFFTTSELDYWYKIFNIMKNKPIDTWDYQLAFSQWLNGGKTILPNYNLVSNIGFNNEATHTKNFIAGKSALESYDIGTIVHPTNLSIDRTADLFSFNNHYNMKLSFWTRVKARIKAVFRF